MDTNSCTRQAFAEEECGVRTGRTVRLQLRFVVLNASPKIFFTMRYQLHIHQNSSFFFFFFLSNLFILRESAQAGEGPDRERGRERESQAVSAESDARLDLTNHEIVT